MIYTINQVLRAVGAAYGLPVEVISSKKQDGSIREARQIFWMLCLDLDELIDERVSLSKIGRKVNRDHSTVIHAKKKMKDKRFWTVGERKMYEKSKRMLDARTSIEDLIREEIEKMKESRDRIRKLYKTLY